MGNIFIYWIQLRRFYLKTETEFNHRNLVFLNKNKMAFQIKTGRWVMPRNIIFVKIALFVTLPKTSPISRQTLIRQSHRSKDLLVQRNPTRGMDVCVRVYSVYVLSCVRRAGPPSEESYRLCIWLRKCKMAVESLLNERIDEIARRKWCLGRD
jgi:hypothetical protein